MLNEIKHKANEGRFCDAVKGVVVKFALIVGFAKVVGEMLNYSSAKQNVASRVDPKVETRAPSTAVAFGMLVSV
jgi:hypothetical protein